MDGMLTLDERSRDAFLLALCRVTGLLIAAPVLGHRAIPVMHRAGLALVLAFALAPAVAVGAAPASDAALLGRAAVELAVGLAVGFTAGLVLAAVQGAAELIGFQMGFGVAAAYDPAMGQQANVLTRFQHTLALLLFLAVDGHHVVLQTLAVSFRGLEPGQVSLVAASGQAAAVLGVRVIRAALELAAPVVGILFLVNVAMALMARVAPQMNVFAVGLPLMVGVGFVAILESLPHWVGTVSRLVAELGPVLRGVARGV